MQNEMMDLVKQFNENAMKSAKRFGELNLKTFETLAAKQSEVVNACFETGSKNVEAMSKAKDPQEAATLQQEAIKACSEKWLANVREAADLLNATREELVAIAEEATKYVTDSAEKAAELNQKTWAANLDKAAEAVEQAVAKASEFTQQAVAATREATEKAAEASKEVADKAVEATKQTVKEVKAVKVA
ncbi:MAG: TIGR01841 family phasin [Thiothrix sp.]|nr:TIGR01841 family phasin [Thiothrix sp.]HPQ95421.1 TIGR01841 family phasin [Thiolinea sp.]